MPNVLTSEFEQSVSPGKQTERNAQASISFDFARAPVVSRETPMGLCSCLDNVAADDDPVVSLLR